MTTGHVNPGYNQIVSKYKLAEDNPSGQRQVLKFDKDELKYIRDKAKQVWSVKDNSETTYGYYFNDPLIKEKTKIRPSSPTRRNNPHPPLIFLSSRMRYIPGYFNCKPQNIDELSTHSFTELETTRSRAPSVHIYPNANHYINSLPNEESQIEEMKLQNLGIDTRSQNIRINSSKQNTINHFGLNSENKFKSQSNISLDYSSKHKTDRLNQLQSNMTNPFLYEDTRMYKEKFKNGDHGIPFDNPRKPFRGDFLIHPDWHPGLKHHRLPYM